ncbi:family 78 glycoside hydrolase catalytic domain [Ereboglobus luteus]|uniref:Uncharacterized protein n=1 Tax=Ereboglobus luteus TaxID=1796921 RepID=A0A2U8E3Q3_9BACT|nr:family 78 glycoside hydrolase catalytic domain [Ereboglobus luteus]AWI09471.1 hypothetical protein CKA38_09620 [Ereboglobus luteus]
MKRRTFLRNSALYAAGATLIPTAHAASDTQVSKPRAGAPESSQTAAPLFQASPGTTYRRIFSSRSALIWFPDNRAYFDTPRNEWCYFRKTFDLPAAPTKAALRIFADSRYRLFVNGAYIVRGPARSDPRFQAFDILDLAPHLKAGRNLIAVQVLYYGYNTGQYLPRVPCLLAELDIENGSGKKRALRTDASWKVHRSASFDPDAPRVNGCQGAIEIFDARNEPENWTQPGFDDSAWPAAKARSLGREQIPYIRLLPRDIPMLEENIIPAARISSAQVVTAHEDETFFPQRARLELDEIKTRLSFSPFAETSVAASGNARVTIITVDFARVTPGYFRLSATAPAGTRIDIAYAEDLFEGRCALFNPPAQRPLDSFILSGGRNDLEIAFAWKGFRYAQLIIRNPGGAFTLHGASLRTRMYPVNQYGHVRTPDGFQRELHAICAHALRGCMQDGFIDSPSREQQQWMGDGRWQAVYNYYLSGDSRLHRRLLYQIAYSQDAEGLTKSRYPDGHENWSPIPSYCLAWVTSFDDYHRFTGDITPAADLWPNIIMALRWFTRYENQNGLLENVPFWSYIDLGGYPAGPKLDIERGGIITALNLLYLESLRAAAHLAKTLGDATAQAAFTARADTLAASISKHLWDDSRGAYPDCYVNGEASKSISEPTNALAILHLNNTNRNRRILLHFGRAETVISSPYSMPLVMRALLRHNRADLAWRLVRERYQPIVDADLGTTWEYWKVFHPVPSGRVHAHSASHAWGAAPLVLFFEGFAGVRILEPAFKRFEIAPRLPSSLDEASFVIPTPAGKIEGQCKRNGSRIDLSFTVPQGCAAVVASREYPNGTHTVSIPS